MSKLVTVNKIGTEIKSLSITLPNYSDEGKLSGTRLVTAPTGTATFTLLDLLQRVESAKSFADEKSANEVRGMVELLSAITRVMRHTFDTNLKGAHVTGKLPNVKLFVAEGRGRKSAPKTVVETDSKLIV